jgi:hypothetical protein
MRGALACRSSLDFSEAVEDAVSRRGPLESSVAGINRISKFVLACAVGVGAVVEELEDE